MNNQQLGQAFDLAAKLEESRNQGHQPGHIFDKGMCFCKICNVPLTYIQTVRNEGPSIGGLHGSKCNL